jgi:hypothetical protein
VQLTSRSVNAKAVEATRIAVRLRGRWQGSQLTIRSYTTADHSRFDDKRYCMKSRSVITASVFLFTAASAANAQEHVALPRSDRVLAGTPTDVFSVGTAEGQEWETFSRIQGVAFDSSDNLYVLDSRNFRVVVFDRSGRFVRQFGKQGSGPGELRNPVGLLLTSANEVVVNDSRHRALTVYNSSGEYVRQIPMAGVADPPRDQLYSLPDGSIMALSGGYPTTEGRFARILLFPSAAAQAATEIVREPTTPMLDVRMNPGASGPSSLRRTAVYAPEAFLALTADGLPVLSNEAAYRLRFFDRSGQQVKTVSRPITPMPVTRETREAYLSRASRERRAAGVPPDFPYEMPFAEVIAVVKAMRSDAAGRIWVQRRENDGLPGPIDIIASGRSYVGTLRNQQLPDAFSRTGLLAYVVTDEMGVERVAVRRQPSAWR